MFGSPPLSRQLAITSAHRSDDGEATTARTVKNVLGEHPAQQVGDTVAR
jgi:hypothetical protein